MTSNFRTRLLDQILQRQQSQRQRQEDWQDSNKPTIAGFNQRLQTLGNTAVVGRLLTNTGLPVGTPLRPLLTAAGLAGGQAIRTEQQVDTLTVRKLKASVLFRVDKGDTQEFYVDGSLVAIRQTLKLPILTNHQVTASIPTPGDSESFEGNTIGITGSQTFPPGEINVTTGGIYGFDYITDPVRLGPGDTVDVSIAIDSYDLPKVTASSTANFGSSFILNNPISSIPLIRATAGVGIDAGGNAIVTTTDDSASIPNVDEVYLPGVVAYPRDYAVSGNLSFGIADVPASENPDGLTASGSAQITITITVTKGFPAYVTRTGSKRVVMVRDLDLMTYGVVGSAVDYSYPSNPTPIESDWRSALASFDPITEPTDPCFSGFYRAQEDGFNFPNQSKYLNVRFNQLIDGQPLPDAILDDSVSAEVLEYAPIRGLDGNSCFLGNFKTKKVSIARIDPSAYGVTKEAITILGIAAVENIRTIQ